MVDGSDYYEVVLLTTSRNVMLPCILSEDQIGYGHKLFVRNCNESMKLKELKTIKIDTIKILRNNYEQYHLLNFDEKELMLELIMVGVGSREYSAGHTGQR